MLQPRRRPGARLRAPQRRRGREFRKGPHPSRRLTTDLHRFSTAGAALATQPTHLGSAGVEWLYSPGLLGKVRIRVTPTNSDSMLFVGIGPSADVDRYLAGVNRTTITDFFDEKAQLWTAVRPDRLPERSASGSPPRPGLAPER
jgi:hypothetical protein